MDALRRVVRSQPPAGVEVSAGARILALIPNQVTRDNLLNAITRNGATRQVEGAGWIHQPFEVSLA